MVRIICFLAPILVAIGIWFQPTPEGLDPRGWHLLAIFVGTILGLIFKPLPMGAVALIGMVLTVLTNTLKLESEALGGFGSCVIWLVVTVFFLARGFIKTNLGNRIAYTFVHLLGKTTLGLGYGLVTTELLIAPFIPSSAARSGGIIYPILKSIAETLGSYPHDGSSRKLGAFLTQTAYHGNIITSAMFLTAMAANPMIQSFAQAQNIQITWTNWALAAFVPGIVSIILAPLLIYIIYPPQVKRINGATELAQTKLKEMGPVSRREWLMIVIFLIMLGLWIFGDAIGINSTTTALLGLSLLLITNILTWNDILNEQEAWHTLIWFAILVMMAKYLQVFGVIAWFSNLVSIYVMDMTWQWAFGILVIVYFYSHYLFASNTSHVGAMYAAFLAVAVAAGTPPLLAALSLGFCSSLFASMTHYGTGGSVVYFGTGYVSIGAWWLIGFFMSLVYLIVWFGLGSFWWKAIGIWS